MTETLIFIFRNETEAQGGQITYLRSLIQGNSSINAVECIPAITPITLAIRPSSSSHPQVLAQHPLLSLIPPVLIETGRDIIRGHGPCGSMLTHAMFQLSCWSGPSSRGNSNVIYFCESESCSFMSNSLRLHGLCNKRNSPGQNTGVGSLSFLQGIFPTQKLLFKEEKRDSSPTKYKKEGS